MVNIMKRVILAVTILTFAVAILCGCNHKVEATNPTQNISDNIADDKQNTDVGNSPDADTQIKSDADNDSKDNNDSKEKVENNKQYSDDKNKDNTSNNNQNESVSNKENNDSQNDSSYKDEVYEAEIDFSQLE